MEELITRIIHVAFAMVGGVTCFVYFCGWAENRENAKRDKPIEGLITTPTVEVKPIEYYAPAKDD